MVYAIFPWLSKVDIKQCYIIESFIGISLFVIILGNDRICRLVELLVFPLIYCSMVMVVIPFNHPLSVESVRTTDWDSRIDQIRGFLGYGFLGFLLFVVNNPSVWLTVYPIKHEIIFDKLSFGSFLDWVFCDFIC